MHKIYYLKNTTILFYNYSCSVRVLMLQLCGDRVASIPLDPGASVQICCSDQAHRGGGRMGKAAGVEEAPACFGRDGNGLSFF